MHARLLLGAALALVVLGCGSSTKHRTSAAQKNANQKVGPRAGTNTGCGNANGECGCSDGTGGLFCGICQAYAPNVCVYCSSGSFCPADPCGGGCYDSDQSTCPPGYALDCGNGSCCPDKFPACCPGGSVCGEDVSDCEGSAGETSTATGGGGTGGGSNLVCVIFTDNIGNSACSCMPPAQAPSGYSTMPSCPSNDCCIAFNPPHGGISCECNSNSSNAANYGQGISCAGAAQKAGAMVVSSCP